MHKTQEKLLQLVKTQDLGSMTLREIGALVGEEKYPQKVKHHLSQLEKKGFIRIDKKNNSIEPVMSGKIGTTSIMSIPILGTANCGPATFYAENNYQGYLKISRKFLPKKENVFALVADGPSMNKACIKGKNIDDGDYLIVDSSDRTPEDGDVVVSVFDDVANIKKFKWDKENNRILLMSESTQHFPPIIIHEDDEYHVMGKVVEVVKGV
tara:strand:- start:436 stop:1065 length:630 start_codon:yes stop_codon:yes gene_type:complete